MSLPYKAMTCLHQSQLKKQFLPLAMLTTTFMSSVKKSPTKSMLSIREMLEDMVSSVQKNKNLEPTI